MSHVMVFFMFHEFRWQVIVRFVDIGWIVDHVVYEVTGMRPMIMMWFLQISHDAVQVSKCEMLF